MDDLPSKAPAFCPHCNESVRAPSVPEMRRYIFKQIGSTVHSSGNSITKTEMVAIYEYFRAKEKQNKPKGDE